MPLLFGSAFMSFLLASRPPAEAPIPTTAKSAGPPRLPCVGTPRRLDRRRTASALRPRFPGICNIFKWLLPIGSIT